MPTPTKAVIAREWLWFVASLLVAIAWFWWAEQLIEPILVLLLALAIYVAGGFVRLTWWAVKNSLRSN
ncbi:MAG: hypothetical protein HY824_03710 [Acidobacteria bacterium]|nr:hypothetical protein [Acidobacteriota bacterium]